MHININNDLINLAVKRLDYIRLQEDKSYRYVPSLSISVCLCVNVCVMCVGVCVYVCVCVCVCVCDPSRIHMFPDKVLRQKHQYRFKRFKSNIHSSISLLHNLDLPFPRQTYGILFNAIIPSNMKFSMHYVYLHSALVLSKGHCRGHSFTRSLSRSYTYRLTVS